MNAYTTRVFRSGNSVAVRLPKELGFAEGAEVELRPDGGKIVIERKRLTNKEMVEGLRQLPRPSYIQEREPFEAAERSGL